MEDEQEERDEDDDDDDDTWKQLALDSSKAQEIVELRHVDGTKSQYKYQCHGDAGSHLRQGEISLICEISASPLSKLLAPFC